MEFQPVTELIGEVAGGDPQAAARLWQHIAVRLRAFARQKLDAQTRRYYDEHDAANSAFHSVCLGLIDGRLEVESRDALWGLLAVITSRKITAQRRYSARQKRGGKVVRGDSGFGEKGISQVDGRQLTPDVLAEVSESCSQLLDTLPDETLRRIVLLKFQGAKNGEIACEMGCTRRTVERKLEIIRRLWVEAGLHDGRQ